MRKTNRLNRERIEKLEGIMRKSSMEAANGESNLTDDDKINVKLSFEENAIEMSEVQEKLDSKDIRTLFTKTRSLIPTSSAQKVISFIFAERKIVLFICIHLILTATIWMHFAIIKFQTQEEKVPEMAPNYYWKIYTPTFEFGLMHSILFQMSLLPLTMCRLTISMLSKTVASDFLPLHRMTGFHIYLGYVMVSLVWIATIVFFAFFGKLCADGEESFCDKFTNEIMITGYCIAGLLLIIGVTSFFRHNMNYERFYLIHHLVFALFFVTALHTFDDMNRQGQARSQTFKWFTASLVYYLSDRMSMRMNHSYSSKIVSASSICGHGTRKMVLLKITKPSQFKFCPGQYAYIRVGAIDNTWHPFSIASGSGSDWLDFIVEVRGNDSWTERLWSLIDKRVGHISDQESLGDRQDLCLCVDLMGPYGCSLGNTSDYTHALVIGTGTGIVPMLSFFKQHIHLLSKLDRDSYLREEQEHVIKINRQYKAKEFSSKTLFETFASPFFKRGKSTSSSFIPSKHISPALLSVDMSKVASGDQEEAALFESIKSSTRLAVSSVYFGVARLLTVVVGTAVLSFSLSWNLLSNDVIKVNGIEKPIYELDGMSTSLMYGSVVFQFMYLLEAFFLHNKESQMIYIDFVVLSLSSLYDTYWTLGSRWGKFDSDQLVIFFLLSGYMLFRSWYYCVSDRIKGGSPGALLGKERLTFSKLHLVLITRSRSLVKEIAPEINSIWNSLAKEWGKEAAERVCKISIFCTDKSKTSIVGELSNSISNGAYDFPRSWIVESQRPNIQDLMDQTMIDRISETGAGVAPFFSKTLLAFCGSPHLANVIHEAKLRTGLSSVLSGNKHHQMRLITESYGLRKDTEIDAADESEKDFLIDTSNVSDTSSSYESCISHE